MKNKNKMISKGIREQMKEAKPIKYKEFDIKDLEKMLNAISSSSNNGATVMCNGKQYFYNNVIDPYKYSFTPVDCKPRIKLRKKINILKDEC